MSEKMLMFPAKLHQLRERRGLLQKQMAEALAIDTPMYCRIEHGERRAKREQILAIAKVLQADSEELLSLWLADQVTAVISTEKRIAKRVLELADKSINNTDANEYAKRKAI